ncbi:hypothetical protein A4X09_0g2168 [Tilletia walkeri]|uniref:Uncharacterized protein n=1 Tax=Tilletia walkeri TaxID=117179 RepID=A0A8X7T6C5_9BASI|nr:hypothetical protein A4X09_0g2168 [Tilletia walkeri]
MARAIVKKGKKDSMMEKGPPERGERKRSRYIDDEAEVSGPESADEQEQENGQEPEADPKGNLRGLVVRDRHPTVTKIQKYMQTRGAPPGTKATRLVRGPSHTRDVEEALKVFRPSGKWHHWEDLVPTTAEQRARQRRLELME